MNVVEIQEFQRNRYPMLFLDGIVELIPGEMAHGVKHFSYNEWFFPIHYEDDPNVPGFILVESMVQNFLMTFLSLEGFKGKKTNFIKIDNVIFKQKVVPGTQMKLLSKLDRFKRGIATGSTECFVEDELVCSGDFTVAVPDELDKFKPKSAK
jgi:3-hydroxyacyl-[acyl-carrier-protein] dehydratase